MFLEIILSFNFYNITFYISNILIINLQFVLQKDNDLMIMCTISDFHILFALNND